LSDKQPIEILKSEFEEGSGVFVAKVASLCSQYTSIRRTRQDGNCFYRSFIFGLLESLLETPNTAVVSELIKCITDLKNKLVSAGFMELVFEDARDLLIEHLQLVGNTEVCHIPRPESISSYMCETD
jgi:ubiquitin thioesterase protein OTUB1